MRTPSQNEGDARVEGGRHKPVDGLRRSEWRVATCSFAQAVELCERLHYSAGAANTATFRHGLYRTEEWPMVVAGCALWIPPTKAAALSTWPENWQGVIALSRLAIEPNVPTNGASFTLAASEKMIRKDARWEMAVTYADEWQGHTGAIYLAAGWEYVGPTKPERTYVLNGRMVARKAGPRTRTHSEMLALGAECVGSHRRLKFRKQLRKQLRNHARLHSSTVERAS